MTSADGTLIDVFKNLIEAAISWGNLFVVFFGLAGLCLAGTGGKRLYDSAQMAGAQGGYETNVLGAVAMVVAGALMTIAAIVSGAVTFVFTQ
ncbi:hypothetical protein OIV19_18245 [Brucella sp. HL-2]|nr:hypothetical protein [Brucella sp. HL-2]MCV9909544.1 hypothetical protein [Brucella sp. HL-2]